MISYQPLPLFLQLYLLLGFFVGGMALTTWAIREGRESSPALIYTFAYWIPALLFGGPVLLMIESYFVPALPWGRRFCISLLILTLVFWIGFVFFRRLEKDRRVSDEGISKKEL